VLLRAGRVEVRQVLRGIPALEAFGLLLGCEGFRPAALAVYELLEVLGFHGAGAGTARPRQPFCPMKALYGDEPSPPLLLGFLASLLMRRKVCLWFSLATQRVGHLA